MADLNDGARAMETLRRELLNTRKVQDDVAREILTLAKRKAAAKPTPQARMVASGMFARRGTVIGFGSRRVFGSGSDGVKLGFLAYGSEFGSSTHRQFGPRNESGYWLHPAAEGRNPGIDKSEDRYIDQAIDAAIRMAGP